MQPRNYEATQMSLRRHNYEDKAQPTWQRKINTNMLRHSHLGLKKDYRMEKLERKRIQAISAVIDKLKDRTAHRSYHSISVSQTKWQQKSETRYAQGIGD